MDASGEMLWASAAAAFAISAQSFAKAPSPYDGLPLSEKPHSASWIHILLWAAAPLILLLALAPTLRFIHHIGPVAGVVMLVIGLSRLKVTAPSLAADLFRQHPRVPIDPPDQRATVEVLPVTINAKYVYSALLDGVDDRIAIFALLALSTENVVGTLAGFMAGAVAALWGVQSRDPQLRRDLDQILDIAGGVFLSAIGTFWTGLLIGASWPGDNHRILLLVACYSAVLLVSIFWRRATWEPIP